MTKYWEIDVLVYCLIASIAFLLAAVARAWWLDRQRWRAVPKHLGSTYDASVKMDYKPRPNVRRA